MYYLWMRNTGGVVVQGVIVTSPLKNNTGQLLGGVADVTVFLQSIISGALVLKKTSASAPDGTVTVTDPVIVPGEEYRVILALPSGAEGMERKVAS